MDFPWLKSSLCRRTRDRLLDQLSAPAPGTTRADPSAPKGRVTAPVLPDDRSLPSDMARHIEGCAGCRSLAEAAPAVTHWAPHWAVPEPPPGLAQQTALRLLPFWTVRERAVNKQEVRMIWSSGLALAATSIVALLMVLDGLFPVTPVAGHHPLVQVGLLVGATQLVGGGLLSLALLALDSRRRRTEAGTAEAEAARGNIADGESSTDDPGAPGGIDS